MKNNDLNSVLVFAKVVEHKSFSRAARALGCSKSSVSTKVAQLEDKLGVRLLERTTRSLRLTEAGHAYYHRISGALEVIEQASLEAQEQRATPMGHLRMTAPVEFALTSSTFQNVLADYLKRYPNVDLTLDLLDDRVDLIASGYDLAIRVGELKDSSLIAKRLNKAGTMALYASPDYLQAHGTPTHPKELEAHVLLAMSRQRNPTRWRFVGQDGPISVSVDARVSTNGFLVLMRLAKRGLGIARLPQFLGSPEVKQGELCTVLDPFVPPTAYWYVVYPSATYLPRRVRAFLEVLMEHFSKTEHSNSSSGVF